MGGHTVLALGYQEDWLRILTSGFMRNALIGGSLVALAAGVIGFFVVVRAGAFAAHALAHIGFPGATGAVLLGVPVSLGLGVFCVGGALVIGALGRRADEREVATGTVLAAATGLGLFFSSLATRSTSTVTNVLFGNLLAVTAEQLVVFGAVLAVIVAVMGVAYRPLLFASINPEVARARGVPVRLLSMLFLALLGLSITMAVQAVGTLLLFAMVVTPAATAIALTARPGRAIAVATGIALVSVWSGLASAAVLDVPPSFAITTVVCAAWLAVRLATRGATVRRRRTARG